MEAKAALPGRWRPASPTRWESKSSTSSEGAPPAAQAPPVPARATRPGRRGGRTPARSPFMPLRSRRPGPAELGLMAQRAQGRYAVAAVCEAQREVSQDPAPARARHGARAYRPRPRDRPREAESVRQRGSRARHEAVAVRRDLYLSDTVVVAHPQGDPLGLGLRARHHAFSLLRTVFTGLQR